MSLDSLHSHVLRRIRDNPDIIPNQLAGEAGVDIVKIRQVVRFLVAEGLLELTPEWNKFTHLPNNKSGKFCCR